MHVSNIKSFLLIVISLVFVASTSQSANGQAWLRKMFKNQTTHDFGDVQLGEVPEYRFQFENVFNETFPHPIDQFKLRLYKSDSYQNNSEDLGEGRDRL